MNTEVRRARDLALQGVNGSLRPGRARGAGGRGRQDPRRALLALREHDVPRSPGLRRRHRRRPGVRPDQRRPTSAPPGAGEPHRRRRRARSTSRSTARPSSGPTATTCSTTSRTCPTRSAPATRPRSSAGHRRAERRHGPDPRRTVADVGARYNRLEAAAQARGRRRDSPDQLALSEIENTDLPKAMVELQMQEVAYQAALAVDRAGHAAEPAGLSEMIAELTRRRLRPVERLPGVSCPRSR